MPFGSVKLVPGVNIERTPTLLEAGYNIVLLGRFRDGLMQKFGGWQKFYSLVVGGVPRDLHAWQDLNQLSHLAVGTTTVLADIASGSLRTLTPQTKTTNPTPNFSTTVGSPLVTVVDPGITNVTTFDSVFFNTPVAVVGGGLILSGLYPIEVITGANSYQIRAAANATATVNNVGAVPQFTTTSGTSSVDVTLAAHGLAAAGDTIVFPISTTGNGVTITGLYAALSIGGVNVFKILASALATANGSFSMNGGLAQLVYYITSGPAAVGLGYGLGGYGDGGYGAGIVPASQTGTPITAADWTTDNWGETLLANPENGGIYYWQPTGGFGNAALITSAPVFNSGMFVSTSAQIVVAYGSTIEEDIGVIQDPMLVRWCDSGNFFDWTPTDTNLARNFRIPIGSKIVTGMAVSNQNLIWTDLDLWVMNFIGFPNVYGFNKIGAGAGAASKHAVQQLRGGVYWMGASNFYRYAGNGVEVIPCPVWDAVFQNLNTAYIKNVRAMPNTPFNEAGWFYPSLASASGENDSYVKMNITEPGAPWDYGTPAELGTLMPRSAWIDQNVFGPPIAASPSGLIYQHETTNDADGQPMFSGFRSGYFDIADGEEFVFVDQVLPDFKWGTFAGAGTAQLNLVFFVRDSSGEEIGSGVRQYGPYLVTENTPYISVRFRGRQMAIGVASGDSGSFWRLGRLRYRYQKSGRR